MNGPVLPGAPDNLTADWWDATRVGRLLIQRCRPCGQAQFYPRLVCTSCGATELGWAQAEGTGTVDTWTVVHRAPAEGIEVPYIVARVRLAEGPVVLSNLVDVPSGEALAGRPVALAWRELSDGRQLPVFTVPARNAEEG
ncbi:MAG: Zn-ribbon domain-containing OB-fold protein [Trebonia sp.]